MQCIEQASSCPQCETGYGWKLGKKKVRNCRQYKEGGRPTRVMGGEGRRRRRRRNSKPKKLNKYYSRNVHFGRS
jgi:hypothetical protein